MPWTCGTAARMLATASVVGLLWLRLRPASIAASPAGSLAIDVAAAALVAVAAVAAAVAVSVRCGIVPGTLRWSAACTAGWRPRGLRGWGCCASVGLASGAGGRQHGPIRSDPWGSGLDSDPSDLACWDTVADPVYKQNKTDNGDRVNGKATGNISLFQNNHPAIAVKYTSFVLF